MAVTEPRRSYGLGDIAARRRHGADGGDGAAAVVGAHALHHAGALVELREARGQVRGVALFAGHLLETAGHLTQGLGPAGGGVGQNGDVVAHVAEVLRDRDAGVDRGLARGHGHVGGVRDQHRALHQRLAVARVLQLGELHQHVGHLIAALAAADVDHDVHVGPLRQLVLHDGLARAEGAGNGRGAALGDGEERVDDALAGVHRARGDVLSGVGSLDTDGPALDHAQLLLALVGLDLRHDLVDRVFALLDDPVHLARDGIGNRLRRRRADGDLRPAPAFEEVRSRPVRAGYYKRTETQISRGARVFKLELAIVCRKVDCNNATSSIIRE